MIAVDARVAVAPLPAELRTGASHSRFAVRPYPKEWERDLTLRNGQRVFIRPIRPEDEGLSQAFLDRVSRQDLRLRFFSSVRVFTHAFTARLTQIDYARAIAFGARQPNRRADRRGEAPRGRQSREGEYGILIRSDLKGRGLGWALMHAWAERPGDHRGDLQFGYICLMCIRLRTATRNCPPLSHVADSTLKMDAVRLEVRT